MTQDEIQHMWKVASNDPHHDTNWHDPVVMAFAKLIAAKEREACAKMCEEIKNKYNGLGDSAERVAVEWCLEAIRAKGEA
jgi:hypothetical protein